MERDFLGLNSMEPLASSVKWENSDEENQWLFMKKASSFPHFAPFRTGADQDNGMNTKPEFSLSLRNSNRKPTSVGFCQNSTDAITKQQHEGVPKAISPPNVQVVGFTEPWKNSKSSAAASQMTIFYGGTVSVYDGISPEKAQAIMLLAGNTTFLGSNKNSPSPQVQTPSTKAPSSATDGKDRKGVAKTMEISMSTVTPSAVPQFRKASLARFLEKRKERVMSNGPYSFEKKQPDGGISANHNAGSAMASASARRS